jgi:cell wall-associated NlpC family hydrolase
MYKKLFQLAFLLTSTFLFFTEDSFSQFQPIDSVQSLSKINRNEVIEYARSFIGRPYVYASANPAVGFDCSGFVHYVFEKFNISLPRGSSAYKYLGSALKPEDFKIGDVLVFYGYRDKTHIGHVGIICEANGMKSKFIHSSSGKAYGVTISELGSEMYTRRFYKCVDVIGD